MKPQKKRSLQRRFIQSLVVATSVILILMVTISVVISYKKLDAELQNRLANMGELATDSLSKTLWEFNDEYVTDFVMALFIYDEMAFVRVISDGRVVKVHARSPFQGKEFPFFSGSTRFVSLDRTIQRGNRVIGRLQLAMSREQLFRMIVWNSAASILLSLLIITGIIATILIVSRKLLFSPLLSLERSVRSIGVGDLNAPIDVSGQDEIGQLAQAFKAMMVNLQSITASRDELDIQVRERVRAETLLRAERDRAQTYLDIVGVILLALDREKNVTLINAKGCRLLEAEEADIIGRNWIKHFIPVENRSVVETTLDQQLQDTGKTIGYFENEIITGTGSRHLIAWNNTTLRDEQGNAVGTLSSGEDITEKRASEIALQSSLAEKDILLREIHHRVKNNLQIIQSLLNLQHDSCDDTTGLSLLDAINRIRTIALIHETLYRSENLLNFDINAYFQELIGHLSGVYDQTMQNVNVTYRVETVSINPEKSIYCGLILNELVTNALKYAFPENGSGELTISFRGVNGNEAELIVSDNGIGLPETVQWNNSPTLGLKLVRMLAEEQLNGTLQVKRENGLTVAVRFIADPSPAQGS